MRVFIHALLLAGLSHAAEMRAWTDVQNRTIEARMLALEGDSVILELKDGRKVPVPLAKLSAADAEFARGRETKPGDQPAADKPNFDAPWPDRIKFDDDAQISTIEEDADAKRFVYESANYRYTSDVRLSKTVVKGFAVMFEATYLFCRSLPLGLDGGVRDGGKLMVRLFENYEDYVSAGGPPDSAGVFLGEKALVLVPLKSLGVQPLGSGYTLDRDKSSKTLPHELTHQLTPPPYFKPGAKGWFTEGIAEYIAVTPYRSGAYGVRNNHRDIIDYVTAYGSKNTGGRALGTEIRLPSSLEDFMLQDYESFLKDARFNYGAALLITYYFLQMDGEGDAARVKAYLRSLRERRGGGGKALEVLLDGRSFEQLENEISKAWKRRGVELIFADGGSGGLKAP
jgi:hypothetical protein